MAPTTQADSGTIMVTGADLDLVGPVNDGTDQSPTPSGEVINHGQ